MRKSNLPLAALVCAAALLLFTNPGQAQPSLQAVHNHVRPAVASGQAVPVRKSTLPLAALVCAAALLLFTNPGQAQPSLQAVHNHVRPAVASGQAVPVSFL